MDVNGVGWVAAIIIGGLAGWLAEMFMKSNMGVLMNIILGIVGAVVLNAILQALRVGPFGVGWLAQFWPAVNRKPTITARAKPNSISCACHSGPSMITCPPSQPAYCAIHTGTLIVANRPASR